MSSVTEAESSGLRALSAMRHMCRKPVCAAMDASYGCVRYTCLCYSSSGPMASYWPPWKTFQNSAVVTFANSRSSRLFCFFGAIETAMEEQPESSVSSSRGRMGGTEPEARVECYGDA